MKKFLIIALVVMMALFAGCSADETPNVNEDKTVTSNEVNDTDKFFPEDKVFTAQLLYEYMVEFEEYQDENGTQQTYIFDLRSADEYAKGHVHGAVNVTKIFFPRRFEQENFLLQKLHHKASLSLQLHCHR